MRFRDEQVRTHRKLRGTTVALMAPACSALGQTPGPWKATGRARDYGLLRSWRRAVLCFLRCGAAQSRPRNTAAGGSPALSSLDAHDARCSNSG